MLITSSFGASTCLLRSGWIHEVQCQDMTDEGKEGREGTEKIRIRIQQHTLTGGLWCAAWLFTVGFLHLGFWKGVLAIVLWPYYLGAHFSALAQ